MKNANVTNKKKKSNNPSGISKKKSLGDESVGNLTPQKGDSDDANDKGESLNTHPLVTGNHIVVQYRDGSYRLAKVLEHRSNPGSDTAAWKYYIHYNDFNRRCDEWIECTRIVKYPSEANALARSNDSTAHGSKVPAGRETDSPGIDILQSSIAGSGIGSGALITTISELEHDEHEGLDELQLLEHEEITKIKNIGNVMFGRYSMECWYFSPFPKEYYPNGPVDFLYFCEFTFRFFRTKDELVRYLSHPSVPRHPPGNEIYRDSKVSMFELDGAVEKSYCQNLCYFAKLFLDHKTLYWDVDPFLFYVLCTYDERGFHPVGFFSKEKFSDLGYNLACILVFPSAQRQGFGRFLISFSYELSKKEEKVGAPEKPLSDLGAVSYKSYWASTLLNILKGYPNKQISVMQLMRITSMLSEDIIATLQFLGLLRKRDSDGANVLCCPPALMEDLLAKFPCGGMDVDPEKLHWAPLYITDPKKDKWAIKSKTL